MTLWTGLAQFASFETQGLVLRPVAFSDAPAFWQLMQSPTNTRFIHPALTSQEEATQLLVEAFMRQPLGVWAICPKADPTAFMGLIRLEQLDLANSRADIGYFLLEAYWGQGVMTEALKNLTFCLFELGFSELSIICHADNTASQKVAQKAGYQLLERFRGSDRYSHKIKTYHRYHLRRRDYRYE